MMAQYYPNKLYITFILYVLIYFICSNYVADLIKKLELSLTVVSVLLKIRFGLTRNRYTGVENSLHQPLVLYKAKKIVLKSFKNMWKIT